MPATKTAPDQTFAGVLKETATAGDETSKLAHPSAFAVYRLTGRLPWSPPWTIAFLGVVLLLIPALLLWYYWRSGVAETATVSGVILIRPFFPPAVVIYLLVAVRLLERTRDNVIRSLRPLVQLDDSAYADVVRAACRVSPAWELVAFGLGAALFFAIEGRFSEGAPAFWYSLFYYLASVLMFGAVGWSVFAVVKIARVTNCMIGQPIALDIFNVAPLEPIGTQSLYLALVFLGLVVLTIPSSPYPAASWQNIAIYAMIAFVIVLVFFVNMYGTHTLLAGSKARQMVEAEGYFAGSLGQLRELSAEGKDTHVAATEVNAWAVAIHELKTTRTWPYNTEMLRTLFISVGAPLVVGLARIGLAFLAAGGY